MNSSKTRIRFFLLLMLVMSLVLVACGGNEESTPETETASEPTNVSPTEPPPTLTPVPTSTPEATATPEPTATPDPVAGFATFEAPDAGVTILYPSEWFTENMFGFLLFASNEELIDAPDPGEEGGIVLLVAADTAEFETDDPAEAIDQAIAEFDLGEDVELVSGPDAITVNGLEGSKAVVHATSDNDTALSALVAILIGGDRSAIFFGVTPQESEAEYLPTFEAMLNTVELSAPVVTTPENGGADISTPSGIVEYGETAAGSLVSADETAVWAFRGSEGDLVSVTVTPLSDDFDLVIDVLDADGQSLIGGEMDSSFGEETVTDIVLPASGQYFVAVRGYEGSMGDYELLVSSGSGGSGAITPPAGDVLGFGEVGTGTLADAGTQTWSFFAEAGDVVDVTVAPLDEDFDVVVDVLDSVGFSILDEGEQDNSFDTEYIRVLFIEEEGYYTVAVRGYEGATGNYEVLVDESLGRLPGSIVFAADTLEEGEEHAFPFTAGEGETVRIYVKPDFGTDVVVGLYNDDTDELIEEVDNTTGFEELIFTSPELANYYFQVSGFEGSTGYYEATLLAGDLAYLEVAGGDSVYGRFGADGLIEYFIRAEAGDTLTVSVSSDEDTDIVLSFSDLDDNILAEIDDAFSGEDEVLTYTFDAEVLAIISVSDFFGGQGKFFMDVTLE